MNTRCKVCLVSRAAIIGLGPLDSRPQEPVIFGPDVAISLDAMSAKMNELCALHPTLYPNTPPHLVYLNRQKYIVLFHYPVYPNYSLIVSHSPRVPLLFLYFSISICCSQPQEPVIFGPDVARSLDAISAKVNELCKESVEFSGYTMIAFVWMAVLNHFS